MSEAPDFPEELKAGTYVGHMVYDISLAWADDAPRYIRAEPAEARIEELERENARLTRELNNHAAFIIARTPPPDGEQP